MNNKFAALSLVGLLLVGARLCADESKTAAPAVNFERLLKAAGAVSYGHKAEFGAGIQDMYIGYGNDGKPVVGIASRSTKTYKEALTIVSVTPTNGTWVITTAEIPDVETFHGRSKTLAKDALKGILGRAFKDTKEARSLVDAVTGATQYYKAIYVSYALMSSTVIEQLTANPEWPRTALQP